MNNLAKLVSLVLLVASASIHGQSQWKLRYPRLDPSGLFAVTYGAGQYVAVGAYRKVFTSADGIRWESRLPEREGDLYAVAHGNDLFVAAGSRSNTLNVPNEAGAIMTSRDGLVWVEESNPDNYFLSRLVFSHDLFIGFGRRLNSDGVSRPVIVTSPDGRNWTERWRSNDMEYVWRPELIGGNGTVVVALPTGDFLVSTNGVDWISVAPGWSPVSDPVLAFGAGKFVAAAQVWDGLAVLVSTDGFIWARNAILRDWNDTVLFGAVGREKEVLVLAVRWIQTAEGETSIESFGLATVDGEAWTEDPLSGVSLAQTGWGAPDEITKGGQLIYSGGLFVMVGQPQTGLMAPNQLTRIFTSTDGLHWTRRNDGDAYLLHVAAGDQGAVAVGAAPQGTVVLKSKTGADWTEAPPIKGVTLNSIAYGNGTYVAAGEPGVFTSSDAVSWRRQDSGGSKWERVRHVGGAFLAFGEVPNPAGQTVLQIGISTNGLDWRLLQVNRFYNNVANVTTDGKSLFAITASSEAAGTRNTKSIWRSLDGQEWIEVYRDSEQGPDFLAFGNGVYVAVGYYSSSKRVLLSADGVNWTAHDGFPGYGAEDIIFAQGKFYAKAGQKIFSSADGRNWSTSSTGYFGGFRELTAGPQGLFATQIGSAIFHAPWDLTLSQPRRSSRGSVVFDINGNSGQQVLIETAFSLAPATWKPLSTNELAGSSLQILDTEVSDASQRFYRASAR